jgi:hypothetical protein
MNINFPVGLIAVFISLYYFYSFKKRQQVKKEERKERLAQLLEELLATLREKPNSITSDEWCQRH